MRLAQLLWVISPRYDVGRNNGLCKHVGREGVGKREALARMNRAQVWAKGWQTS